LSEQEVGAGYNFEIGNAVAYQIGKSAIAADSTCV
jgi:hypothetical protein